MNTAVAPHPSASPPVAPTRGASLRSTAIDVLKGLAIIGVLVQHSFTGAQLHGVVDTLHVRQAVPVFAVLLALNAAGSLERSGRRSLAGLYTRAYFARRVARLGLPFAIAFLVATAIAVAKGDVYVGPLLLVAYLPLVGPGTYYLTLLLQQVVVFPALWLAFGRRPLRTTAACVAIAAAYDVAANAAQPYGGATSYLLSAGLPHYLPTLCAGLLLARAGDRAGLRVAAWLAPASVVLLLLVWHGTLVHAGLEPQAFWASYSLYGVGLPMLVVAGALVSAPLWAARTSLWAPLVRLGRASFHVFLAQVIAFGALPDGGWWSLVAAVAAIVAGVVADRILPQPAWGRARPAGGLA